MILLPIAMAIVAGLAIDRYLQAQHQALQERHHVAQLVRIVANHPLKKGAMIKLEDLASRSIPSHWVSQDMLDVHQAHQLEGRVLLQDMVSGQPFSVAMLANPAPEELTSRLAPGRRALTLPVDFVNAISGLLKPGDFIDLFVTFEHEGKKMTSLIVSAVRVLATDQTLVQSSYELLDQHKKISSVTLDVSPIEAVKLVAARQDGVLTAVLRVDKHPNPQFHSQSNAKTNSKPNSKSNPPLHASSSDASHAIKPDVPTGHLAGFAGVDATFGQPKPATIIYGDAFDDFMSVEQEALGQTP